MFSVSPGLTGQNFAFRKYDVLDGLPQSQTTRLYQDSRGFLWIGTANGLSRFDGVEFINYFSKDGLPSNNVYFPFEDSSGILWTLSHEGISKYNGRRFEYYPPSGSLESFWFSPHYALLNNGKILLLGRKTGSDHNILVSFKDGIYTEYYEKIPDIENLHPTYFCYSKELDVILLMGKNKRIYSLKNNLLNAISEREFDGMYITRNGIEVTSKDSLFRYEKDHFIYVQQTRVWERYKGRYRYSASYKLPMVYGDSINSELMVPFNPTGVISDSENVLWFTSESNLSRLLSTAFSVYPAEEINVDNLWSIAEDRVGHIWFGCLEGALIEYDGKTFRERNEYRSLFGKGVGFYKGSRKMSYGDIWFSTNTGVLIWNGWKFSRLNSIPDKTQVCYIYEDPVDGSKLLGTDRGLFVIKGDRIKQFPQFNDSDLGVIEGCTRIEDGKYLLSGHKGLVTFDGVNSFPVREKGLPAEYTYTIEKDRFGGIWVTSDEGLFFRSGSSESFINGLPESVNKPAISIKLMDTSHIIVGRTSDLCVIDLERFYKGDADYFRVYDKTDGFEGSDCIDNGIIKDMTGKFWILTSDRIIRFEPSRLKHNQIPPKLHITGLLLQDDSLVWKPVNSVNLFYKIPSLIKLNGHQNRIQITFSGISTTNPERVTMQYRLVGYDKKWSSPSTKRNVIYENLPPGNFTFELKAKNADGVPTPESLIMPIRIVPAFWQTTAFKILIIVLCFIFTVTATSVYLARRQRKKEEDEQLKSELSRLQMNSILKQFDPHFTFNVISSVGSLILKGEKEMAYDYITKLSGILRTVLSDGFIMVKPLSEELDFVRRYCQLQKLRFKDRFNFNITVDEKVDLQREIPKMTIQTFVENAIKHGFENRKSGGTVEVFISKTEAGLEIVITDNGIGRKAASDQNVSGNGYGIKILSAFFEMMNSRNNSTATLDITDLEEDKKASGTMIRISIPDSYNFDYNLKTGNPGKSNL